MQRVLMVIVVLALTSVTGCRKAGSSPSLRQGAQPPDFASETEIREQILTALGHSGKSVRLYLHGSCEVRNSDLITIPPIKVNSVSDTKSPVQTIQRMFQGDPNISVAKGPSGIIQIKDSGVSDAILKTEISALDLPQNERYDPNAAIRAVLNSKEVQEAMRNLDARPVISMGGLENMPSEGAPHLESEFRAVTFDQALDKILRTFPGVIEYRECTKSTGGHLFDIHYSSH